MVSSSTPTTRKSYLAPSSQKKGGTPTPAQSREAHATQLATATIKEKEKLRLGPLAQQQEMQQAQAGSSNPVFTPSSYTNHPVGATQGCPSFDLNMSFHEDEGTNRGQSTELKPHNLDACMSESGDEWGLDPEELQKVCYEAEKAFALKKEKERLEMEERLRNGRQNNDQNSKTPVTATTDVENVASSSRTPTAVGHGRRVVRAPPQLRSPYIRLENTDPFYCSKQVRDIYDVVCQYSVTHTRQADNSKPIINYDVLYISCNELAQSMAPG